MLGELTAESSFTRIEEDVRRFWRRREVPSALQAARHGGTQVAIYQQPLLVAGERATDQVRLLVVADLLARYRAMRGDAVTRSMGWVCHGLSVELAVERSLGPDVAGYDLTQFNAACREAAIEGLRQGEALIDRLASWTGLDGPFISLEPQEVGTVWAGLRKLWDAGRLRRERRVADVCPRCSSPLSSAEAARHSVEAEGRSVWVRLPWDGEPDTYFLTWTQTPWALVGMVALAVHPEAAYILVERETQDGVPPHSSDPRPGRLLLAEAALRRLPLVGYRRVKRLRGRALRSARYHPVFTFLPADRGIGRVILSEDVPLDQGTGLWPVMPAFDALSLALAQSHDLPVPQLLDDWGALGEAVTPWRGLSPLDAEPLLMEDVQARGLLLAEEMESRPRCLCPYCDTPLLPLASSVWLVETGSGPWIVSRDRAWGVPLPVWACTQCGDELCVTGLDDLARRTGVDTDQIDPHRPAVDRLVFPCEGCGGTMRRVPAVVDAAFESAVLSWSAGSRLGSAHIAVGMGDKHLGWLGDLGEITALLGGSMAWEQALHLPASEPEADWGLARIPSADALRWAAYAGSMPDLAEHDFLRPLWRSVLALVSQPSVPADQMSESKLLDRWVAARLNHATDTVTRALDAGDPRRAAAELASLVTDLADWAAHYRLGGGSEVLEPLCRLLAPFVPHLAEAMHRSLGQRAKSSVHLAAWPSPQPVGEDPEFLAGMARVLRWARLGQHARTLVAIGPVRPLGRAIVCSLGSSQGEVAKIDLFHDLLLKMLGVAEVEIKPDAAAMVGWHLTLDPLHWTERDLEPAEVEAILSEMDAEESTRLASQLRSGLSVGLRVSGRAITLLPDEVRITAQAPPGWAAAADAEYLVVLDAG